MYPSVVSVIPHDDFTLAVTFDTGEEGVLDMRPHLTFGVFRKIAPLSEFRRVKVAFDTIEWECGVDLDPEFVHSKCRITSRT